jgi:uncharacterized protein (TIGR02996 family)
VCRGVDRRDQELLRAIAADCENDEPRRRFADLLDSRGEHEHADFIRDSVEEARATGDLELSQRLEMIVEANRGPWQAFYGMADGVDAKWERGVPKRLFGSPEGLAKTSTLELGLIDSIDIHLTLASGPDLIRTITSLDGFERVHTLRINGGILDVGVDPDVSRPDLVRALALGSRVSGLRHLTISSSVLDDEGAIALASAPFVERLTGLDLLSTRLTRRALVPLLTSARALQDLELNSIPDAVYALLDAGSAPSSLSLIYCKLLSADVFRLCASAGFPSVRRFYVQATLGGELERLMSLAWPRLESLSLVSASLGDGDVDALRALDVSDLQELSRRERDHGSRRDRARRYVIPDAAFALHKRQPDRGRGDHSARRVRRDSATGSDELRRQLDLGAIPRYPLHLSSSARTHVRTRQAALSGSMKLQRTAGYARNTSRSTGTRRICFRYAARLTMTSGRRLGRRRFFLQRSRVAPARV